MRHRYWLPLPPLARRCTPDRALRGGWSAIPALGAAFVTLALCLGSCAEKATPTQAGGTEMAVPIVPVAKVSRAKLSRSVSLTAEFEAFQEVEVMAKVAGYVKQIHVDIGDHVKAGQVLAVLEVPEMLDDATRASATIEQADAEIAAARDELARSEAAFQISHLSFSRLQEVAKREAGLIAIQELDEAQSREQEARSRVAGAKSRLRVAEQRLQVAKAEQARTRTMGNYVTITAPFAGTITKRYADTGSMVQAGIASRSQALPVVQLSQGDLLRLRLPVPESMVPTVRVGRPVEVEVPSLARTFAGRVARFSGKVDVATRSMVTEVDVPNPTGVILPGMYAQVLLGLEEHNDVLSVPIESVERHSSGPRVYVVGSAGEVQIVPIQLGIEDTGRAEIIAGLAEGDQVVVGKRAELESGERVRAKLVESAARN